MSIVRFLILVPLIQLALTGRVFAQEYESFYLHLGAHPWDDQTDWSESLQGITHDANHWYIVRSGEILKIPVHYNLQTVTRNDPGVMTTTFGGTPLVGYSHFGDADVYRHNGIDYLLVPAESIGSNPGIVVFFRCSDLSYVRHAQLTAQGGDAGWCAVSPTGRLFSSLQRASSLHVYDVHWECLESTCDLLSYVNEIPLFDEQGQTLPDLVTTQGGVFAPGGTMLYLTSGFFDDNAQLQESEGITVIDTATWRRTAHSTNGYGTFNYFYSPNCCSYGEPEGLTFWDLDNGISPGVRGQLHVIRVNNDPIGTDDITVYHYTNVIHVAPGAPCTLTHCCDQPPVPVGCPAFPSSIPCAPGGFTCPYESLDEALSFAWPGTELRISPGNYSTASTISKRVRLTSAGGIVRIGG